MRRLICLTVALLLCVSFAGPIFAAEEFTPSVSYKGTPDIVTVKDPEGEPAVAIVTDATGKTDYVDEECMWLTPVARAAHDVKIPDDAEKLLLSLYSQLTSGSMTLPYGDDVKAENMVIRDMFDISWLCGHDHDAMLLPEGVVIKLTFDLGVAADEKVVVMTYKNTAWGEIADVQNNGDGTVTCTFEHLCPVAIAVEGDGINAPDDTGDKTGSNLHLWIALMSVSAVAVAAAMIVRRKVQ